MQQIQQQINLYHTLFYVCLGICIFSFLLSVLFFFKFNIRSIFNIRTGRSVKKTVQRVDKMNSCMNLPLRNIWSEELPVVRTTDILKEKEEETEILYEEKQQVMELEKAQAEVDESFGMFQIEKYLIFIHTDEEKGVQVI